MEKYSVVTNLTNPFVLLVYCTMYIIIIIIYTYVKSTVITVGGFSRPCQPPLPTPSSCQVVNVRAPLRFASFPLLKSCVSRTSISPTLIELEQHSYNLIALLVSTEYDENVGENRSGAFSPLSSWRTRTRTRIRTRT